MGARLRLLRCGPAPVLQNGEVKLLDYPVGRPNAALLKSA
jgi:hypothetical protein